MPEGIPSGWEDVVIKIPCISWEECECLRTGVGVWLEGKYWGDVMVCQDCGRDSKTVVIWTTSN